MASENCEACGQTGYQARQKSACQETGHQKESGTGQEKSGARKEESGARKEESGTGQEKSGNRPQSSGRKEKIIAEVVVKTFLQQPFLYLDDPPNKKARPGKEAC